MMTQAPDRRRTIITEDNPFGRSGGKGASPHWHNILLDYSMMKSMSSSARVLLMYVLERMRSDYSIVIRTRSPSLRKYSGATERTLRAAIRELECYEVLSPRRTPDVFWINPQIIIRRKIFV